MHGFSLRWSDSVELHQNVGGIGVVCSGQGNTAVRREACGTAASDLDLDATPTKDVNHSAISEYNANSRIELSASNLIGHVKSKNLVTE